MVWVLGGGAWLENGNGVCYLIHGRALVHPGLSPNLHEEFELRIFSWYDAVV